MSQIAVDIVLLPDAETTARAIEVNADLVAHHGSGIVLGTETCLPHISLAMGCIDRHSVESIRSVLQELAGTYSLGDLTVTGVVTSLNRQGESVSVFALAKTRAFQGLHQDVMAATESFFSYDVREEMICGTETVAPSTLDWIRHFRQKAAFEAFFPHITLGYGTVERPMNFPIHCSAAQLAICHLGNHCTCRKILASIALERRWHRPA